MESKMMSRVSLVSTLCGFCLGQMSVKECNALEGHLTHQQASFQTQPKWHALGDRMFKGLGFPGRWSVVTALFVAGANAYADEPAGLAPLASAVASPVVRGSGICAATNRVRCICADVLRGKPRAGASVRLADAATAAVLVEPLLPGPTWEHAAFVVERNGRLSIVHQPLNAVPTNGDIDAAAAELPPGAVAVIHAHARLGMLGDWDARPLLDGMPMVVVSERRIGVVELVDGVLQLRMLAGKMGIGEAKAAQGQLNRQQRWFMSKTER